MANRGRNVRRTGGRGPGSPGGPGRAGASTALLALALIASGCSPGENEILNPGSHRAGLSALPETLRLASPIADRDLQAVANQGRTAVLRVARADSVEAISFLRFATLPDTSGVTHAYLGLRWNGGEGTNLHISAHRVLARTDWTETGTTHPSVEFADSLSSEPLSSAAVTPQADSTLERRLLEIPLAVIRDWITNPSENRGIALRMTVAEPGAAGTLDFLSRDAILDSTGVANPQLEFFQGDASAAIVGPTADTWIYLDHRVPATGGEAVLRVTEWMPSRGILQFPVLDSLRARLGAAGVRDEDVRRLTVNRAVLSLRVADYSDTADYRLIVHRSDPLPDEAIEPDSLALLSTQTFDIDAVFDPARQEVRLEIGGLVRELAAATARSGLVLRLSQEGSGADRLVLHSREAAADTLRPSLEIVYTRPADARWGDEEVQP